MTVNDFLNEYSWVFGYAASFFAGVATVLGTRLVRDIREDRKLPREDLDRECGYGYDEESDVVRITDGWEICDDPKPVSPGSSIVIAPSPILREPSGGYSTIGTRHLNVDQRYATLQWLDTRRPTAVATSRRPFDANVIGVHRKYDAVTVVGRARILQTPVIDGETERCPTAEIDLNALWEKINLENSWQRTALSPSSASA